MNEPKPAAELTPLKRAFLAIEELQGRLDASERARHEPIAIVGASCRLPGDANSLDAFWTLLRDGVDAITETPPERWDVDAWYDADVSTPGKMSTRHGGFVHDADRFDPQFFNISPREAAAMDPQQRFLLEVTWEALENAGIAPAQLAGTRTAVYVALTSSDYAQVHRTLRGLEGLDAYYASGIADSIASGRISYVLGLEGPSISIDTACSSSLVAVHLAVQSLRSGESRTALAGGVNLILSPENSITLSKYQMMAPDGRCKFGDARADGFVRAEGCAMVVLKRLRDAMADGDPVLAVIRGTATSQDGASSGLTAPNGPSQEAVLRAALADAGVAPAEVGYIEAHGTGTALGDPIELQALGAVFGKGRPADVPLVVGSVKTNIGHGEAVAGISGLLKLALALQHGEIPASLHFQSPNPLIDWEDLPLTIPVTHAAWPAALPRRIGGVSSFGFSGTNVHLVLEQPPAPPQVQAENDGARPHLHLLPLSARSETALRALAASYASALQADPEPDLADFAFTAGSGRNYFAHRMVVTAANSAAAAQQLARFAAPEQTSGGAMPRSHHVKSIDAPAVVFLFTGQGAQYAGMGRTLYATQPVFRQMLDKCADLLAAHMDRPLLDLLFAEPGSADARLLDQTTYTQPALLALEIALAALWRAWGVTPTTVLGHSVGEFAAAWLAGVLSLEDALALVAARGRLMGALPAGGAMAALFAPPHEVEALLTDDGAQGRVVIAAYNGPEHTVISGPETEVQALVDRCAANGMRAQRLSVSHAFHSPLLDPALDALEAVASGFTLHAPRLRLISNLTGAPIGREIAQPGYWREHARQPVRFTQSLAAVARLGNTICIEIGPHPVLIGMAKAALPPDAGLWLPSLRKGRDETEQLFESVAGFYLHGGQMDWAAFCNAPARRKLRLPTYPFERDRYWVSPLPGARAALPGATPGGHPLLGRKLRSPLRQQQFENEISVESLDYLRDHNVFGTTILPATAFLEIALAAAQATGQPDARLQEMAIHEPLIAQEGERIALQTILAPPASPDAGATFEILSQARAEEPWRLHVAGQLSAENHGSGAPAPDLVALETLRTRCTEAISSEAHYAQLAARGLNFGPSLRGVQALWRGEEEILGHITLPQADEAARYRIHPALLDACIQCLSSLTQADGVTFLPMHIEHVALLGSPGSSAWAHATLRRRGAAAAAETLVGDIHVYDEAGQPLAALTGLLLKRVAADLFAQETRRAPSPMAEWLFALDWEPRPSSDALWAQPTVLATPSLLAEQAAAAAAELGDAVGLAQHAEVLNTLEELSTQAMLNALAELGVEPVAGAACDGAQLPVAPVHRRLLTHLLDLLANDGWLRLTNGGWTVARAWTPGDVSARWAALFAQSPQSRGEIAITQRAGTQLANALRGTVDPLEIIFPGGSSTDAEQMYHKSPATRFYNGIAAQVVNQWLAATTTGRPLRILEIGAGTGGTTAQILPQLVHAQVEYVYTDISPLLLARASEVFGEYPFVSYRQLDIERDPLAQGFEAHHFDLVVAANVLHATSDLRRTFAHVAQLLAPAGLLLLVEMTRRQRYIDISFGLTAGWWSFSDHDLRPRYPLLDPEAWLAFLRENGFDDAQAVAGAAPSHPAGIAETPLQSVIVARAKAAPAQDAPRLPEGRRRWLLLADEAGVGKQVADEIERRGGTATLAFARAGYARDGSTFFVDPAAPDDFRRLLDDTEGDAHWDSVVHLWNLDNGHGLQDASGAVDPGTRVAHTTRSALLLTQAMVASGSTAQLCFVTRASVALHGAAADPAQAPLWGLARVVALEHPELRPVCVDLSAAPAADGGRSSIVQLIDLLASPEGESQIALRADARYVARLATCKEAITAPVPATAVRLALASSGALDDMTLRPARRRTPGPGEVELRVHAAGLNFRDVMNALAMRDDAEAVGSECAGTITAVGAGVEQVAVGDAVIAVAPGSFGSYALAHAALVVQKPTQFTFAEAATLPLAFLTAQDALFRQAHLQAGERVLIHAAAGGVGLAAVQLALRAGAVVYATAGTQAKRNWLLAQGVRFVADSRNLDFADDIRKQTSGRGVDVVLNSLIGDFIPLSLELLAPGGRFVELGKRDAWDAEKVHALRSDVTLLHVPLADEVDQDPHAVGERLRALIAMAAAGELAPLPHVDFPLANAKGAFRYMAQARHIGKIILVQPETQAEVSPHAGAVRADATYLISGGLAGLGLSVAEWLVDQGARALVLFGRSLPDAAAQAAIARMRASGATVEAARADVTDHEQLAQLFAQMRATMPPLRGIIHSAGVLDDAALSQQDWQRFAHVLAPKVNGAWHLHTLSAGDPLDFFVLFSSAASLFGSRGQANHAAANYFMDALAAMRRARGLPALSINWGPWADIGSVVKHDVGNRIAAQGLSAIPPEKGLEMLGLLMQQGRAQVGVVPVQWPIFFQQFGAGGVPRWLSRFAQQAVTAPAAGPERTVMSVRAQIEATAPAHQRRKLQDFVSEQVARVIGIANGRPLDEEHPLRELGLDSLMAVELRNLLGSGLALERPLPATLAFDYPTIEALTDYLAQVVLKQPPVTSTREAPITSGSRLDNLLASMEEMSDEDIDRAFADKLQGDK